jgi:heme o synthase
MLPVVAGEAATRRQILFYTLVLAPLGASPWFLGFAGWWYGAVALAGGAVMIALALRLRGDQSGRKAARRLFAFSIFYLFLLFAALLAERVSAALLTRFAA